VPKEEDKKIRSSSTDAALKLPEELPLFAAISGLSGAVLGIFIGQKA
jgi:hypothetical protein